nr:hypothetical protein [Rhodococcus sp. (in: high G+C Gram-positive bacteria)]
MSRLELLKRHHGVVDGIIEAGIYVGDDIAVLELIDEVNKLLPYVAEAVELLDNAGDLAVYTEDLEHAYDFSTEVIRELVEVAIDEGDNDLAGALASIADGMEGLRPCP